jgi:hypothetical protein
MPRGLALGRTRPRSPVLTDRLIFVRFQGEDLSKVVDAFDLYFEDDPLNSCRGN